MNLESRGHGRVGQIEVRAEEGVQAFGFTFARRNQGVFFSTEQLAGTSVGFVTV